MNTNVTEMQIQSQLSQVLQQLQDIHAKVGTNELLQILESTRDQVNRLSREHESIRSDIRDLRNSMSATTSD